MTSGQRRQSKMSVLERIRPASMDRNSEHSTDPAAESVTRSYMTAARYELIPWGYELRDAVHALGRWAGPLMARPRGEDHFQVSWLHHMVIARFDGHDPDRADMTVELCTDGEVFTLESLAGHVRLDRGRTPEPDIILAGPTEPVVAYLLGRIDATTATAAGVSVRGPKSKLHRLRPRGEGTGRHRDNLEPQQGDERKEQLNAC